MSSGDGRRWVQYNGPGDVETRPAGLDVCGIETIEVAAMTGEFYTPTSSTDPVAVFLRARRCLGGHVQVTGDAPAVPTAGGYAVPGLVY